MLADKIIFVEQGSLPMLAAVTAWIGLYFALLALSIAALMMAIALPVMQRLRRGRTDDEV